MPRRATTDRGKDETDIQIIPQDPNLDQCFGDRFRGSPQQAWASLQAEVAGREAPGRTPCGSGRN